MFRIFMLSQVNLTLESGATIATGKGFDALMLSHVGDQVWWLWEGLATDSTIVWFFACVNVSMFFHVRLLMETLATVRAGEGSRIRVDQQVSGEGRAALEFLVANVTRINLLFPGGILMWLMPMTMMIRLWQGARLSHFLLLLVVLMVE
jgi:hypothetical protein